jgi:hypothetical protein
VAELRNQIELLEERLDKLDIGVAAWHRIAGHDDDSGWSWSRDIGYTQIGHRWRIALRKMSGADGDYDEQVWTFDDAPKWMAIESVGKLPDLMEELLKRTEDTIKKINNRASQVSEFVEALAAMELPLPSPIPVKRKENAR